MTSTVAASSASRTGLWNGSNMTLVPTWIVLVRAAMAAAMGSSDGE